MSTVRLIRSADTDVRAALRAIREPLLLDRLLLDDAPQARTVTEIIADVRRRGDDAVAEITARVDHADIPPDSVRVPPETLADAHRRLPEPLLRAVRHAIASLRRFQQSLIEPTAKPVELDGKTLSLRWRPLRRVGICVPAAAAPLPSSAIHCAVPAQVAGVKELVLVSPPRANGDIHPTILAVAHELGIGEVYRMGGAQGVAALALGTERVRRVDKIVGPGGPYVQLAKRALFGVVDIDMFAATTEVLIIADASANPAGVAADMLAQAEHDPGSAILLADDAGLAERVREQIDAQLAKLPRADGAKRSLERFGAIVVVRDLDEAAALANELAPEHLHVETADPRALADRIDAAGAIFLGHHTPEATGDYLAGPSHVLPTGGTARFWSGLSALSFLRSTSMIEYSADALSRDAASIDALAQAEGLDAHARSAAIRGEDPR